MPTYDGDSQTLHHWLTQVEGVLAIYAGVRANHVAVYNVWIGFVRSRVTGAANEALVNRNVANVWEDIRVALIDHFETRGISQPSVNRFRI